MRFPDKEWSGVIFYTMDVVENEVIFYVKHFYPLDIGDGSSTSIENYEDIIDYYDINPHAEDNFRHGLMHSHHKMETFFSGVDQDTLVEQSDVYDIFLSIITNNAAEYKARVAWNANIDSGNVFNSKNIKVTLYSECAIELEKALVEDWVIDQADKLEDALDVFFSHKGSYFNQSLFDPKDVDVITSGKKNSSSWDDDGYIYDDDYGWLNTNDPRDRFLINGRI